MVIEQKHFVVKCLFKENKQLSLYTKFLLNQHNMFIQINIYLKLITNQFLSFKMHKQDFSYDALSVSVSLDCLEMHLLLQSLQQKIPVVSL